MTEEQLKDVNKALNCIGLENVQNIIVIKYSATNKDVFKGVFGYEPAIDAVVCNKADWCGGSEPCNYCKSNPNNIGREEDWWNASYKVETKNQ